jgi:hypothetical protein
VEAELLGAGTLAPPLPPARYHDTLAVRAAVAGAAFRGPNFSLWLRAGAFFEPSFVGEQTGRTNQLDGDKIGLGLGFGLRWERIGPLYEHPVRIDVHGTLHHVADRAHTKIVSTAAEAQNDRGLLVDDDPSTPGVLEISNPGFPQIDGGGWAWAAGLTLVVER